MQGDRAFPGAQSAFEPAGQGAEQIDALAFVLTAAGAAVFLVFCIALAYSLTHRRRASGPQTAESDRRSTRWIVTTGAALPLLILIPLLFYTFHALSANDPANRDRSLVVEVRGRQWWWEVRYLDEDPARQFVTANEIRVPVGRPVELHLYSDDVIHSFWVPSLAGKADMIPGHRNRLVLKADEPGVHRGQCAEYCGGQHALMSIFVIVEPEADFERWRLQQARDAAEPADELLARGRAAFMRGNCGECHTVRGTEARGDLGPDLTHVGSRRSLGAGVLDNHIGTMAGWIAGTQAVKPGSLMPDARMFDGAELRALSAWLKSLE